MKDEGTGGDLPDGEARPRIPSFLEDILRQDDDGGPPAPEASQEDWLLTRVPTCVAGLDEALHGGIPFGHVVLLEGAPGTMKSSLAFWILAHNAPSSRGLYVTCEERTGTLLQQMKGLGVPLGPAEGRVVILDGASLYRRATAGDWLQILMERVQQVQDEGGLGLLVIDSLDALEVMAKFKDRRRELFRLFEWLRDLRITTFLIVEGGDAGFDGMVPEQPRDEDFLADGVVNLQFHPLENGHVQRRIRVVKMRGTRHETSYLSLQVCRGEMAVSPSLGG